MWAQFMDRLTGLSAGPARRGSWGVVSWQFCTDAEVRDMPQRLRAQRARYHLGRARCARDAGHPEAGVVEARRALRLMPANPWALSVLGQCLLRQAQPDLVAARRATEQAWALDPTNGYFVRLLLDVLEAQGDVAARAELLDWAWWKGAPVERWLPDGGPALAVADRTQADDKAATSTSLASPASATVSAANVDSQRQPVTA
jgi:hypothetical protein